MSRLLVSTTYVVLWTVCCVAGADGEEADGWVCLFDGKTLNGWNVGVNADSFRVEDGVLVVHGPRAHLFYSGDVEDHHFKDSHFKADVRTTPGSNPGLIFHTPFQKDGWPKVGYEVQVNISHRDPNKSSSLLGVRNVLQPPARDDEWYTQEIIVRGKRIITKLNGKVQVDFVEPDNVSGLRKLSSRTFAIQAHDPKSKVYIKNVAVTSLGMTAASGARPKRQRWLTPLSLKEALMPYSGPVEKGVDTSTLYKKVMSGYQGWFMARGDGFPPGFVHWGRVDKNPPRCTVDFWPDLSELDEDEKFPTQYKHADGSTAYVFSSTVGKTVHRHFRWMKEYGIDGAFVQRFTGRIANPKSWNYHRTCVVLHHCREGANRHGRAYAVMYDTGFDRKAVDAMKADWTRLMRDMKITSDPAYVRHRGAPVISLWGYGFKHRRFDAGAAEEFFKFLKKPENGACTIMLGLPNDWVTWKDDRMRLMEKYATIMSPWNVGRYRSPETAKKHFARRWPADLAWCKKHDRDYYAVVFPGFSWTNLQKGARPLNSIPRLRGRFLWSQFEEVKRYGMNMAYVAMFDEVDEGTAIFKCTNHPPVGRFCTYEGLPSDFYLKLVGNAARFLRGEKAGLPDDKNPTRRR